MAICTKIHHVPERTFIGNLFRWFVLLGELAKSLLSMRSRDSSAMPRIKGQAGLCKNTAGIQRFLPGTISFKTCRKATLQYISKTVLAERWRNVFHTMTRCSPSTFCTHVFLSSGILVLFAHVCPENIPLFQWWPLITMPCYSSLCPDISNPGPFKITRH